MVIAKDKTTINVSKDTKEWLTLLKRKLQASHKQELSQDDIVRLALACLDDHKDEADLSCLVRE
jgi:DNA-binding transcriptional regulator YhcF (GntR family)